MSIVLFYSDSCPYCRTLLEEIKRRAAKEVKLVCIEVLVSRGQRIPAPIHSVPALLTLHDKRIVFGKNVFDALFLPGSGALVSGSGSIGGGGGSGSNGVGVGGGGSGVNRIIASDTRLPPGEPEPYALGVSASGSDNFSFFQEEDSDKADPLRSYSWAEIGSDEGSPAAIMTTAPQADSRIKSGKGLPDISNMQMEREADRKNYLNSAQLPPPEPAR